MKKILSLIVFIMLAGMYSLTAQTVSYTVTTSSKCSNLTAEFTIAAGKVANLTSLDVVPTFKGCDPANQTLSSITVTVKAKQAAGSRTKPTVYYKKNLEQTGLVSESVAASTVKLNAGNYVLEVSPSSGTVATLTLELFDN
ncbi:hypothetical protein SDC9_52876 [bioreactor metagenome]|uniref:Uncharacterized protein n=1 Tax=bioreactor metagenome TaxID=1076179 RepID=A0A644WRR4_9ZZZZ